MGNGADFFTRDAKGRRSEYVAVDKAVIINGIKGKVIKKIGNKETHTNLPYYSNTSDIYFRKNKDGVCQGRVYVGQKKFLDLDWSHNHINDTDGRKFTKGVVHVQMWQENSDGTFSRVSDSARLMSNMEMKRYGPLIKYYSPNVKFR